MSWIYIGFNNNYTAATNQINDMALECVHKNHIWKYIQHIIDWLQGALEIILLAHYFKHIHQMYIKSQ